VINSVIQNQENSSSRLGLLLEFSWFVSTYLFISSTTNFLQSSSRYFC